MNLPKHQTDLKQLAEFVHVECQKRLDAYKAQPR